MSAPSERITFPSSSGRALSGRIERSAAGDGPWALFAHCFSCSKDSLAAVRVSRSLAARGVNVLRFDFAGLGGSDGDFADTSLSSNVSDVVDAAAYLRAHHAAPSLLIGHSLGGVAVILAASALPEARALALIAAPSSAGHLLARLERDQGAEGAATAHGSFAVSEAFAQDLTGQNPAAALGGLRLPILIAHSPTDEVVGIEHASALFAAARHPKSFLSLEHADHLLSQRADAAYAADVIAAWASRYVTEETAADAAGPSEDEPGVVVRETRAGRYQCEVTAGPHRILVDEPVAVGGDGTGLDPYELLSASLGACTTITLRMYADRKNISVDRITTTVRHHKGHADDCAACDETQAARVDIFERSITLEGALDDAQRARLMEIADKCPVHRTLHSPIVVRTRLTENPVKAK